MKYTPVKSHTINGIKYRVALKNQAIILFEEMASISFNKLLALTMQADNGDGSLSASQLLEELKYTDLLKFVYACMMNAKQYGPYNNEINAFEDVINIGNQFEDSDNSDFADFLQLFGLCFQTMDGAKQKKLAAAGKQKKEK